jgi:hypothetical protein
MRKLVFTAAAAATLFAAITGGTAADFGHQVTLTAVAPVVCSIGAAPTSTGNFSEVDDTASALTVLFTESSNVAPQTASLNFGQVFCTGPSTTVSLERTFLELHGQAGIDAAAAGFSTKIDYTAAVNWGGGANILSLSADQGNNQTTVLPKTGVFVLNINIPGNVGPFAAAENYEDILVLTVGPTA